MSVKLGTLTLDLVTKIGNFVGPINEAESKLTKSFSKMRDSVNKFGLIAVSAGAGAAAAVIAMADTMAKQNAELERFAYLSQTSVAEFQKMSVGAKMMGIEADKLSDIMKDWNERFGDFLTSGGGPLVDFMEQVAVKTEKGADGAMKLAKELSKLSGPESMGLFVKKMEEANLSQDQMSFLMESMASDATQLLPLLKNNAEGMRLWGEAAERAGIIMDEDTLKASRELQVQTQMLDMQYEGLKKQLLSAVVPALVDVSEAMLDGDKNARGMADAGEVLANSLRGVAAVGIGLYATINLIANAMAGISKSAVDSYRLTEMASKNGAWYEKLPGIKLLKTGITFAVTSQAENSGLGMALDDNAKVLEDAANKINGLFDTTVSTATAKLAALQGEVNQTNTAATQGAQDWLDKQNKVTDATKAATKAQFDLNKAYQDAVKLAYDYGTEYQRIEHDLTNEIKTIRESALGSGDKTKMIVEAKAISEARKKVYLLEYQQDLDAWSWSEDHKLAKHIAIEKARVIATKGMSKEERQLRLDSFDSQLKQELAWLELEKQQRISNASEAFRTDMENIAARYEFERKQILLNKSISDEERKALLNASVYSQNKDESQVRDSAISDYRNVMGFEESPLVRQFEVLQKMRELDLINEEAYQKSKLDLTLKYGASYMESMLGGFASLVDENSKTYAVLFAAQKAFAVAQAMLNIPQAYSKAYDAVVGTPYIGPYIAPAVGAAAAALQVAQAAKINSVNLTGMAHDGISSIPEEGTWLLNKGERVLNPEQNKDLTNYLNDRQAVNTQSATPSVVDNNMKVVILDDRSAVEQELMGPSGEKAFLYHWKRNQSKLRS